MMNTQLVYKMQDCNMNERRLWHKSNCEVPRRKNVIIREMPWSVAYMATFSLEGNERCEVRVMPECGGVPSTHFSPKS
jgi:hypothetical protein